LISLNQLVLQFIALLKMSLLRFKLVFFAPKNSTRDILNHLFNKFPENLGKIGNYQQCAFITPGTG